MNILILSHEYPPFGGGGANACQNLSERLAKYGHHVHILTIGEADQIEQKQCGNGSLTLTRLKTNRTSLSHSTALEMFQYLLCARKAAHSLLREEHFDICLCFFGIPSGLLARRLKKTDGLPYVIRFGGGDVPGFQDRFQMLYKLVSPVLRAVWRDAGALIANSKGLKDTALDFCDHYPIDVIYNGVDASRFFPAQRIKTCEDGSCRVELLTVCRLLKRKGIQDVIPYLKQIEAKAGKDIHWTIVGDGPYRNTLEQLAVECNVAEKIHFTGHLEQADIIAYYQKADIFVFPSYREGMPNTVLEAMATGLPILMRTSCQGADELVSENGLLAGDDGFENALSKILSLNEEQWMTMGEESRRMVMTSFLWDHSAQKYESLIRKVVTGGDSSHDW